MKDLIEQLRLNEMPEPPDPKNIDFGKFSFEDKEDDIEEVLLNTIELYMDPHLDKILEDEFDVDWDLLSNSEKIEGRHIYIKSLVELIYRTFDEDSLRYFKRIVSGG